MLTSAVRITPVMELSKVIHLDTLAEELDLPPDDHLEEFIIDAIQVNAISVSVFSQLSVSIQVR